MPVVLPVGHFDATPHTGRLAAPVTALAVVVGLVVFVGPQRFAADADATAALGAVPAEVVAALSQTLATPEDRLWSLSSIWTSLTAHASWAHLFYNLVALWVFGSALERAVGRGPVVGLYLGAGALAVLAQVAVSAGSSAPIVGASGAVAAAAGAFAVTFPRSRVIVAALFLTVPVPASVALGVWAAVEVTVGFGGGTPGVAHAAHLSGFGLGALFALLPPIRLRATKNRDSVSDDRLRNAFRPDSVTPLHAIDT